jgi:hypothetical protein
MQAATAEPSDALLRFNDEVLEQALHLVAAHAMPEGPRLAGTVGAHLRHIIEHHQALLLPAQAGVVDYDSRARDRLVETHPAVATQRLLALREALARWSADSLGQPVQVRGLAGSTGAYRFEVPSTRGRELAFAASHAVHHFALLKAHCLQSGIPLPAHFGVAPATVAHESRQILEEPTCPPSLQAA